MRYCLLLDKKRKRKKSMNKTQWEKFRETRCLSDLNNKSKDSILREHRKRTNEKDEKDKEPEM